MDATDAVIGADAADGRNATVGTDAAVGAVAAVGNAATGNVANGNVANGNADGRRLDSATPSTPAGPSATAGSASRPASRHPGGLLLDWAIELQSLAQAGLTYGASPYDLERYQRIRDIAADMLAAQSDLPIEKVKGLFCNEIGYQTPKLDTRAAIFDESGRILLVHENNGTWALPGGWVDIDQSVEQNTIKEAKEESGLDVTADRVIAIQDRAKHNLPPYAYGVCKIFMLCTRVGGEFESNIETTETRYFAENELPRLAEEKNNAEQIRMCFAAHRDPDWVTRFE